MALALVLFACLVIRFSLAISPVNTKLHEPASSLHERMNRFEQLIIQQDLAIKRLEREKQHWQTEREHFKTEREHFAEFRSEWEKAQEQWTFEKLSMKEDTKLLKHKLHEMSSRCYKAALPCSETAHAVVPRSDDINPLEPVVTQMVQRLTEMSAEVQALKNAAGGSVYVRWGSSGCSDSTSLVYSGVVGGSAYSHTGAATGHLCLSLTPIPSDRPVPTYYSSLHGAEYYTSDTHNLKDPVCAVCQSPRSMNIMIPGTNRCESGWTMEYSGFLMASYDSNAAGTDYICVDSQLQSRIGSDAQQNGDDIVLVLTSCGSLPCEPYVDRKVVTCVVCSK